ncbi:MAG: ATP-binding protein [Solirubrobacterales bacterium]|nr:ATP-binding protein [Solirubrobacterales bacterium]
MSRTRRFDHVPESVPLARQFSGQVLARAPEDIRDVVALMVSELASNCIRHTDTGFELTMGQTEAGIRVEATDDATGDPRMRAAGPSDTDGRGLQIIDMFASEWGFDRRPQGGKTVWFTLSIQAPEPVGCGAGASSVPLGEPDPA